MDQKTLWKSNFIKDQVQNGLFSKATNPNILPVNVSFLQKWWMYKLQLSSSEHSICQTGFPRFTYRKRHFLSTDNEYGWAIKHWSFKVFSQRKPMNPVHSVTSLNRPLNTNSQNKQLTLTLWTDSDLAGWTLLSSLLLLKLAGGCWTFYILHKKILCFFFFFFYIIKHNKMQLKHIFVNYA